ncbi:MAG TPA: flagellar motor protein MotA [Geminicoccaceae bacterium]|nr:flagellar motor protein MotA [Geminicoccaceae bacterium]
MTNPQRFVNRMILFLVLAGAVVAALYDIVFRAFMHNPALNGLILGVLLVGVVYSFRRVATIKPEIRWIKAFRTNRPGFSLQAAPRLLAPVASALGEQERRGRAVLSAVSVRYLLDSISSRLDESRDISRYQIGLLIFLGLLGTFWGLLQTINAVSQVIGGLSIGEGDLAAIFDDMKAGLSAPLSGMGTAFSSSLFGLAGSLILGFLDLQATQAQNAFFIDADEWLSSLARLSGPSAGYGEGEGAVPAYVAALLEQTAENLETLQRSLVRAEEARSSTQAGINLLVERLAALGDQMAAEQRLLGQLLGQQEDLKPVLARLANGQANGFDEATRSHIRNMDVYMARLLEETVQGRSQMISELRSEIKTVSRTIAAAAGDPQLHQG